MGYIPSGSTNDFASSLLIPKTVSHAVKNIIEGTQYLCDVGSFNGRWFNYVAAFGIFTEVSYATPQQLKNTFGHQATKIIIPSDIQGIAGLSKSIVEIAKENG
jgi:diacylglycerol kinase family enzyme